MRYLLLILLWLCSFAASATPSTDSALAVLKNGVTKHTLPNGLRVMMYRRGNAPVFAGAVAVHVGGVDEPEGLTGISHLFEHMAFKGTTTVGTKDYRRERALLDEMEEIAARSDGATKLRSDDQQRWIELSTALSKIWNTGEFTRAYTVRGAEGMNATTQKDLTTYMTNLPKSAFEFWCWIESERLLNPVLREFYSERDVVMEERRMRYDDDPLGKLYEMLLFSAYTKHPYRNPVIGYPQDISRLRARQVEDFRRAYYVPGNMAVALVGDVDPQRDLKIVQRYFGRLPIGPVPSKPTVLEPAQTAQRQVVLKANTAPQVLLAYHKPNYPHPDDPAISIMLQVLAGSRSSPLNRELVEKQRIVTHVDAQEAPGDGYPNLMMFDAKLRGRYSNQEFIQAFDRVVERFKAAVVPESDVAIARRAVAVAYLNQLKSNLNLAVDMVESELVFGSWEATLDWYRAAMEVSAADVQRVAQRYLIPEGRTIAMAEPAGRS